MMKSLTATLITLLTTFLFASGLFGQVFGQAINQNPKNDLKESPKEILKNEALKKEIFEHYKKFDIAGIRNIVKEMPVNLQTTLGRLQIMLDSFYKDHPARPVETDDLNPDISLENQRDPDYKLDKRRQSGLEKLREKQTPRFIKNAPNLFELHLAMARGLRDARKKGVFFSKNPLRSSYHFITALRYRSLKLTPEIWLDQDRLDLLNDDKEKSDAENYQKALLELANARNEYDLTKRSLYVQEDNSIAKAKDPGANPSYKADQDELSALKNKILSLEQTMEKQIAVYESYAESYNRETATTLLEFAEVVNSVDDSLRDKEKILNAAEYYRSNYDGTFKQNWQLESRKSAYINLLETASLLDPKNPLTPALLAREYKTAGDNLSAAGSYEKSLEYNENSNVKLTEQQLLETYRNLGGLYFNLRRYVDSAYYYEQAYAVSKNDELEFQLAKIHFENSGNYDRARELLEDLSSRLPALTGNENPEKTAEILKSHYDIYSHLAQLYEKTGQAGLTLETLKKSASIHSEFENLIVKNYDLLRNKEKIMVESRVKFNREPDENNMQVFYQAAQDYRDLKNAVTRIESMRKSINFQKTYFSLAWRHEQDHNIQAAIDALTAAESFGLAPDEARREISRIKKEFFN